MFLADRLTLDAPRRTSEGYLAVRAKAARTGVYDYRAGEVGAPPRFKPTDTVKVYRDAADVFAEDAVRSFLARPITNDHPRDPVTSANWRDHARGINMGAMRDGDYLAFDLVLMDASAIADVEAGKRELSNGYACDLDWTPGTAPDGTAYDARQTNIRGNHIAIVDAGRAGPECAIKDGQRFAACDANPDYLNHRKDGTMPHTLTIDGLQVPNVSDEAKAAIEKLQGQVRDGATALTTANDRVSTLEGEKAALQTQLDAAKAAADPAALDKRVADRAAFIALAKAAKPDIVTDGKSDGDIRKEIVVAKLGDKAPTDDAGIAGAFSVLTADVKVADGNQVQNIAPAAQLADAETGFLDAQRKAAEYRRNAWKTPATSAV